MKVYIWILLAMIFWSVSYIWTKVAIHSFHPVTILILRLTIASVLLFVVSKFSGKFQRIRKSDLKWFVMLAFFEPFMYFMGETYGLTMVESTVAAVIISTIPLFAPILAFFWLRERVRWNNLTGILVSLTGVFFLIYAPGLGFSANPAGVALMFLAVFSAIVYATILKEIPNYYHSINVILYQSLFGLMFFIPTFMFTDLKTITSITITSQAVFSVLMLAVFASVIAFVLFANVIREIGVTRTNAFVNIMPVFTAVFAWWFLGEKLTIFKIVGILCVVLGLFVSQLGTVKLNLRRIRRSEY